MKIRLRTVGVLLLAALTSIVAGAALFVYLGIYDISAIKQHTQPVYSLLEYAMRRSVSARTDHIAVPDLAGTARIRDGAVHYLRHCVQCHGAPGVAPDSLAFGMTPMPVNLVSTAREWPPEEIYWVVRHGIKMSGMPAWEYRLSDEEIWNLVAFIKKMATMTVPEYAAFSEKVVGASEQGKAAMRQEDAGSRPGEATANSALPAPTPAGNPAPGALPGNVEAGKRALNQYLCATCHQIPGITGANKHVGPPLNGIATRRYIGGIIANNPENLVRWLIDPQQFDPLSAMPALGVTTKDAQDMAAFLYTLDDVE
jgi:mono/diheme cytochrome c family protein